MYMNNTQGVQGPRTAVMMVPSATNPPGVDLDKVAASISEQNQTSAAPVTVPVSQTRQFGRSLAGVLSGAAQNIKSKIAGMGAASPSAWGHPWAGDGKIHLDRASNYFMDALNARDSQQT